MVLLSKVVLHRTVGAMTAAEDSREQRRLQLELFCEAGKTGRGMKTALG